MANFDPAAIKSATEQIRSLMGVEVEYDGGAWFLKAAGRRVAVESENAAGFDDILADATVNVAAAKLKPQTSRRHSSTPLQMAQQRIFADLGKHAVMVNGDWLHQNVRGNLVKAGQRQSAAYQTYFSDAMEASGPNARGVGVLSMAGWDSAIGSHQKQVADAARARAKAEADAMRADAIAQQQTDSAVQRALQAQTKGDDDARRAQAARMAARLAPVNGPGSAVPWNPYISAMHMAAGGSGPTPINGPASASAWNPYISAVNNPNPGGADPASMTMWQRFTNTPAARAVLRPARKWIGTFAGIGAIANVRGAEDMGGNAARSIVGGAADTISAAMDTGRKIGDALLQATLAPFGKSGAALGQFASSIGKQVTDTIGGALHAFGGLAGAGGKAVGLGVGLGTAGLGAAVGGIAGLAVGAAPGWLIGAALGSLVGVAMMKIAEAIASAISSALAVVGKAFGAFGDAVVGALKTISEVLSDITTAAGDYAKKVLSLSHLSGGSIGSSIEATNNMRALGVDPSSVPGLSGNRWQQRMMQGVYGVSGEFGSAEYISSFSRRYRGMADRGGPG